MNCRNFLEISLHHFGECSNRLLKNDFLTRFSCKNLNDFEGQFFKTWLFQQPAKVILCLQRTRVRDSKLRPLDQNFASVPASPNSPRPKQTPRLAWREV